MKLINRRSFLKSIATACGAAVVCPGELLKSTQRVCEAGWYDFNPFGSKAERKKYRQNIKWKNYYADHQYSGTEMRKLLNKLEKEFWNTAFKSPLMRSL